MHLILSNIFIHPLIISIVGLVSGLLSGLLGIGGGFVIIPILMYLGIPPSMAIGASIAQIITSALTGAQKYITHKMLDWNMGIVIVSGSLIGIIIGTFLFHLLNTGNRLNIFINVSYILLIIFITIPFSIFSIIDQLHTKNHKKRSKLQCFMQKLPWRIKYKQAKICASIIPPFIVGIFAGILNSLLGLGGGLIVVPVLTYLMYVKPQIAIGTSLLQMFVISIISTFIQSTINHNVDLLLVFFIIISAAIGARVGAIISLKLPILPLKFLALCVYSIVFIHLIFRLFAPPLDPISIVIPLI